MTCFFCKGNLEDGFTTHVVDTENRVAIIRSVPCLKCDQCGETSYTGTIFKQLESIVRNLLNTPTEVAIVQYSKDAA